MQLESTDQLDRLINEEKRRVALEFFQDAWNSAVEEGIEPSILAESALLTAFTQLHTSDGEEPVRALLQTLPDRLESGHFDAQRVIQ